MHGENIEFGDEVTVTVVAQEPTGQVGNGKLIDYRALEALEAPLNETIGDTFYVDRERDADGSGASVNDLDLSVDSWIVVQDDNQGEAETPGATPKLDLEEAPCAPEPEGRGCPSDMEVQRDCSSEQV